MQHVTSNNVWSFWPAILRQFAWGLMVFLLWSLLIYNLWRTLDDLYLVCFNPLNPNIKIQILVCYPYTFSIEVVGRIC